MQGTPLEAASKDGRVQVLQGHVTTPQQLTQAPAFGRVHLEQESWAPLTEPMQHPVQQQQEACKVCNTSRIQLSSF
jgi:hypothetical protein